MTETELTREVLALAKAAGVLAHHCPDSRRCDGNPGFPDLVLVGEHGIIVAELKTEDGDTSAEQDLWLWTLSHAGHDCCEPINQLWRPSDLESGRIRDLIGAIR